MLSGPILPTLLKLALPTAGVMVVQTLVSVLETFYVGFLGKSALVGVALVFPVSMLMTMTAGAGIGSGVASAIARAIGAGRQRDADALVWHAVVLAVVIGLGFSLALLSVGPRLYRALGGEGAALEAALLYSGWIFVAAVPIWITNLLSAALRGSGNVKLPAQVTMGGALVLIPLSPLLIFGVGPIRPMGIAGAGAAVVIYYTAASLFLLQCLRRGYSGLTLRRARLEWRLFKDVLSVGVLSALSAVQLNITIILVTGAVGTFGPDALAAYGLGSRLDYLMSPLVFGIGAAALTMVGANVGAGYMRRAKAVAWTAVALGAGITETVGLFVAVFPQVWIGLFSRDPGVVELGQQYLRLVGPVYGALGIIVIVNMASQGGARPLWAFLAGSARLFIAAGVGWFVVAELKATEAALYGVIALSAAISATICLIATGSGSIFRKVQA